MSTVWKIVFSHVETLLQVFASRSLVSKYRFARHCYCYKKPNNDVLTYFLRESGCQTHAITCGAGTGVYLLIRVLRLVLSLLWI